MSAPDTAWFYDRIEARGDTLRSFAHRIGYLHGTLSRILRGGLKMRVEDAEAIARGLGEPLVEVMRHGGMGDQLFATMPVAFVADAEGRLSVGYKEVVEVPFALSDCVVARIKAPGAGTDGWLMLFDPLSADALPTGLCAIHVAGAAPQDLRLGWCQRGTGSSYRLTALSGKMHEDVRVVMAGTVRWIKTG